MLFDILKKNIWKYNHNYKQELSNRSNVTRIGHRSYTIRFLVASQLGIGLRQMCVQNHERYQKECFTLSRKWRQILNTLLNKIFDKIKNLSPSSDMTLLLTAQTASSPKISMVRTLILTIPVHSARIFQLFTTEVWKRNEVDHVWARFSTVDLFAARFFLNANPLEASYRNQSAADSDG